MEEQKGYEVIHFIEHGSLSRITMDYVEGELLILRMKKMKWISKEQLFQWIWQLSVQMEQFHRCRKKQCYRYLSPESVMVTDDGELYLLDLEAESNAFVIRHMQRREMRRHFVKEEIISRENIRTETDLYSLGKTIQYILAHLQVEPKLSRREERQLTRIIQRCVGTNSKKIYQNLKEIQKDIPKWKDKKKNERWKQMVAVLVVLLAALITARFLPKSEVSAEVKEEIKRETVQENSKISKTEYEKDEAENDVQERLEQMKGDVSKIQTYMQQNTAEDNKKIIDEGVELEKELLRYLAIANDREENLDEAVQYYHELVELEDNQKQLEIIYLRMAAIEIRQDKTEEVKAIYEKAVIACPKNQNICLSYIEFLCKDSSMESDEKNRLLQEIFSEYPELSEVQMFQKLQKEYGIKVEGEKVWIEKE